MNDNNKCPENRHAIDIGAWENEGGSPDRDDMEHHFGRRIEPDRSWTIYHVFTGVPADMPSRLMVGLSETDATSTMICLNERNMKRRHAASLQQAVAAALTVKGIQPSC